MALNALQEIEDYHQTIKQARIYLHEIPDERIGSFATLLWSITSDEAIQSSSEWEPVIRQLKTYFFHLRSIPVSSDTPSICPYESIEKLSVLSERAESTYPHIAEAVSNLQDSVEWLAVSSYSVLRESIDKQLCPDGEELNEGVVLKDRKCLDTVRDQIASSPDSKKPKVLYYRDIGRTGLDRLHLPGRPWWFPDHLFRAPPAREVHVYSYAWHRDSVDLEPVFDFGSPLAGSRPEVQIVRPEKNIGREAVDADLESLDSITGTLDPTDWEAVLKKNERSDSRLPARDAVPAGLYHLEDDLLALMPVGEEKVTTLDLDSQTPKPVRKPASSIQPGEFVVIRRDASDDLLRQVANEILGKKKEEVREKERKWKAQLRARCQETGVKTVANELRRRGVEKASRENVHRWAEGDTIRPRSEDDFRTIMEYIGLKDKHQDYWDALTIIVSAHQRAGYKIRDALLACVKEADVDDLLRRGRMDFTIGEDSARLTAARVLEMVELDARFHPRRLKAVLN
jgi:hypothetical protein